MDVVLDFVWGLHCFEATFFRHLEGDTHLQNTQLKSFLLIMHLPENCLVVGIIWYHLSLVAIAGFGLHYLPLARCGF